MSAPFARVVVCGVGLIGGSFALALKKQGLAREVVGLGRSRASLEEALALGIIDSIAEGWADALAGADLVLLAMPVGSMTAAMEAMAPHLEPQTLVTDAGSTKRDIVEGIYTHLRAHLDRIVPAHPIAGAERSGASAATAELYQGRRVVLTPLVENSAEALARVREAWSACGAELSEMSPQEHDRVFAAVSHLPHLLAFALVHDIAERANSDELFSFAASGFRDFSRIASSHPEMWRDICIANRHALQAELDAYLSELAWIRALLAQGDGPALEKLFTDARDARNAWLAGHFNA